MVILVGGSGAASRNVTQQTYRTGFQETLLQQFRQIRFQIKEINEKDTVVLIHMDPGKFECYTVTRKGKYLTLTIAS